MKRHLIVTVAFALIIVTAPNARAAMCFQYTKSGGGISVAQATLPEPNKCITFALYEVGDKPGTTLLGAGTGSLCRSTQSNFVIFHYTYDACMPLGSNNYFESATCRLQLSRDLGLPTRSATAGERSQAASQVRSVKSAISITRTTWSSVHATATTSSFACLMARYQNAEGSD